MGCKLWAPLLVGDAALRLFAQLQTRYGLLGCGLNPPNGSGVDGAWNLWPGRVPAGKSRASNPVELQAGSRVCGWPRTCRYSGRKEHSGDPFATY